MVNGKVPDRSSGDPFPVTASVRDLPKIDELLAHPAVASSPWPRWAVVEALRRTVDQRRRQLLAGQAQSAAVDLAAALALAGELCRPSLRRVVNATGVVLHTNLGRAPLPPAALEEALAAAAG